MAIGFANATQDRGQIGNYYHAVQKVNLNLDEVRKYLSRETRALSNSAATYGSIPYHAMTALGGPGAEIVDSGNALYEGAKEGDVRKASLGGLGMVGTFARGTSMIDEATDTAGIGGRGGRAGKRHHQYRDIPPTQNVPRTPMERGYPLGFNSTDEFTEFGQIGQKALAKAKHKNVTMHMQGSAITGKAHTKRDAFGNPLPFRPESDFDVALAGKDLFDRARKLKGLKVLDNPSHIYLDPKSGDYIKNLDKLGLKKMQSQLEAKGGRTVIFMLFQNENAVLQKSAATIAIPGGG